MFHKEGGFIHNNKTDYIFNINYPRPDLYRQYQEELEPSASAVTIERFCHSALDVTVTIWSDYGEEDSESVSDP